MSGWILCNKGGKYREKERNKKGARGKKARNRVKFKFFFKCRSDLFSSVSSNDNRSDEGCQKCAFSLVWQYQLCCLSVSVVLSVSISCAVCQYQLCCLTVSVVLSDSISCAVWQYQLCCLSVSVVLSISISCAVCQYQLCCLSVSVVLTVSISCAVCQYQLCCLSVSVVLPVSISCAVCQYQLCCLSVASLTISAPLDVYESMHRDTTKKNPTRCTIQVNLLFQVSCTCFGRCCRPPSGTLDFIYSIW